MAFVGGEVVKPLANALPQVVGVSFPGFAQEVLESVEDLLNRVQVGRIGGQEQPMCASGFNGVSHRLALAASQIIEHDHIAGAKRRRQELFDVAAEYLTIDRPVDHAWAPIRSWRRAARKVVVRQCSWGNLAYNRWPRRLQLRKGALIRLSNQARWPFRLIGRCRPILLAATLPVARSRWDHFTTLETLTPNVPAACRQLMPVRTPATIRCRKSQE